MLRSILRWGQGGKRNGAERNGTDVSFGQNFFDCYSTGNVLFIEVKFNPHYNACTFPIITVAYLNIAKETSINTLYSTSIDLYIYTVYRMPTVRSKTKLTFTTYSGPVSSKVILLNMKPTLGNVSSLLQSNRY